MYHSVLEEDEASYPDSGPVTDSREGGPKESESKLEEGIGSVGGDTVGKPLPRHLGQEMGCCNGGASPCRWGPGVLLPVLMGSKLQGLLWVLGTVSPLPKVCGCPCPCPCVCSFLDTISLSNARYSALLHPGVGQVFTYNLFHFYKGM